MKKIILLGILVSSFSVFAQCPLPTNVHYTHRIDTLPLAPTIHWTSPLDSFQVQFECNSIGMISKFYQATGVTNNHSVELMYLTARHNISTQPGDTLKYRVNNVCNGQVVNGGWNLNIHQRPDTLFSKIRWNGVRDYNGIVFGEFENLPTLNSANGNNFRKFPLSQSYPIHSIGLKAYGLKVNSLGNPDSNISYTSPWIEVVGADKEIVVYLSSVNMVNPKDVGTLKIDLHDGNSWINNFETFSHSDSTYTNQPHINFPLRLDISNLQTQRRGFYKVRLRFNQTTAANPQNHIFGISRIMVNKPSKSYVNSELWVLNGVDTILNFTPNFKGSLGPIYLYVLARPKPGVQSNGNYRFVDRNILWNSSHQRDRFSVNLNGMGFKNNDVFVQVIHLHALNSSWELPPVIQVGSPRNGTRVKLQLGLSDSCQFLFRTRTRGQLAFFPGASLRTFETDFYGKFDTIVSSNYNYFRFNQNHPRVFPAFCQTDSVDLLPFQTSSPIDTILFEDSTRFNLFLPNNGVVLVDSITPTYIYGKFPLRIWNRYTILDSIGVYFSNSTTFEILEPHTQVGAFKKVKKPIVNPISNGRGIHSTRTRIRIPLPPSGLPKIYGTVAIDTLRIENRKGDNFNTDSIPIFTSWDPNNKVVYPAGVQYSTVDTLSYTIQFQNLGTAPAKKVVVMDTLDNRFKIENFKINYVSHDYRLSIENGVMKFVFENINLPDSTSDPEGSIGEISFQLWLDQPLNIGDSLANRAFIYFDNNYPIITNNAWVAVKDKNIGFKENELQNVDLVKVFPNPSTTELVLASKGFEGAIQVLNIEGKVIKNLLLARNQVQILNVEKWPAGMYILKFSDGSRKKILIN